LLSEVRRYGRFDVRGCFNCGSCTVSCALTDGLASFPRRPIQYVLLGLTGPVHASLEPWLCHGCGDCSTSCPQQAEPGESLATLRRYLTAQYDWTGLSARIYRSTTWAIGALVSTGLLVLLLAVLYHSYVVGMPLSGFTSMSMGLEHMFDTITHFTRVVIVVPLLLLISNACRMYWLAMHRGARARIPPSLYLAEMRTLVLHMLTQREMRRCSGTTAQRRHRLHWMLAAGCVLMLVILVGALRFFQTDQVYPVYHPQRWLGYLAAALMIIGSVDILVGRIRRRPEIHKFSEVSDVTFPVLLFLTAVTGLAVHAARYMGLALVAHYTYALHLAIAVPLLVVEMPFGRWSHMLYRPVAIYLQAVKERALQQHAQVDRPEAA